ncbi:MAG TPA: DUF2889 domain-containing protein [Blastocatellia bacterium]|jgi:hypothetical protein|nr:DUF2889 domain-containing protein [Blastocatellia bacterium]
MTAFSRTINVDMDWIDDSSFEIRGTLDDNVHTVTARFLIGFPDYVIREASGGITRMPYDGFCQGAYAVISKFVGETIGRGFRRRAAEIAGGSESCNHLHTLIFNMGTAAFQMNYMAAKRKPDVIAALRKTSDDPAERRSMVMGWMPQLRNSCFVFSEASDVLFDEKGNVQDEDGVNSETGEMDGKVL